MVYLASIATPSMSNDVSNAGFHFVFPFQGNGGDGVTASVGALATPSNFSKCARLEHQQFPLNGRDANSNPNPPISSLVFTSTAFKSGNFASITLLAPPIKLGRVAPRTRSPRSFPPPIAIETTSSPESNLSRNP